MEWTIRDVTLGGGLILSKREELQGDHISDVVSSRTKDRGGGTKCKKLEEQDHFL